MKDTNHHSKLIDELGGPSVLAEKLGYDKKKGGVQRVANWRSRGIPAAVILGNQHLFTPPGAKSTGIKMSKTENISKSISPVRKAGLIQRLFIRYADIETAEQKLWMAVLCNAVMDLMTKEGGSYQDQMRVDRERREAASYFERGYYVFACDMVGLDPDWVFEVLRDHAGLEV